MAPRKKKAIYKSDLIKLVKPSSAESLHTTETTAPSSSLSSKGMVDSAFLGSRSEVRTKARSEIGFFSDIQDSPIGSFEALILEAKRLMTNEEFRLFLVEIAYEHASGNKRFSDLLQSAQVKVQLLDELVPEDLYNSFPSNTKELDAWVAPKTVDDLPKFRPTIIENIDIHYSLDHMSILRKQRDEDDSKEPRDNKPMVPTRVPRSNWTLSEVYNRRKEREIVFYCRLKLLEARANSMYRLTKKLPDNVLDAIERDCDAEEYDIYEDKYDRIVKDYFDATLEEFNGTKGS